MVIHPDHFVIGVDVGIKKLRYGLSNLMGELLIYKEKKMPQEISMESLLDELVYVIKDIKGSKAIDASRLLGIGISMHGIVDSKKGMSRYAPSLNLHDIPVKEKLEELFGLPVRVENDAKAMALGEKWFGNGKGYDNFTCINIGEGIGAGIMINGELFNGHESIAGEIGHMVIDLNGPQCSCGGFGCFQTLASGQALRERTIREISLGRKTMLTKSVNGDLDKIEGALIHEHALNGDELCLEMIEKTGRFIGIGIVNIIHMFNPNLVIIGGGLAKAKNLIMTPLREVVNARVLTGSELKTKIMAASLGEKGSLMGAITLVLAELFSYHYHE